MRKATLVATLLAGVALCAAHPSWAQFKRYDYNWARMVPAGTLTLDGKMNEPAWAQAESVIVKYRKDAGIPGSGWKDEGGFPATDSLYAVFKFLTTTDNQLWVACTVRDSSIGGSSSFNNFDGLLMDLEYHASDQHPSQVDECFVSWWWPSGSLIADPNGIDNPMAISSQVWRTQPTGTPPTPAQQLGFDAAWSVKGHVNTDAQPDTSYTVEMRWDLPSNGYNALQSGGDIMEWNVSVYDCDWNWPLSNFFRFSANRTWLQNPWGNTDWYSDYKLLARSDIGLGSALPAMQPDLVVPNLGNIAPPVIDGYLNDAAWVNAPSFRITYGDSANRATYKNNGPWRSGEFQAPVNGNNGTAFIVDPADCTVKYFFKADTLYLGFDFNDQFVQYHTLQDRWDGAIVTLDDRVKRNTDQVLLNHHISFQVGPTGQLVPQDELGYLRDTLGVVRAQLQLKPNTTVDTLGTDIDEGYTAEMAIDLTAFGYTPDLGDHTVYFGIEVIDGDSFSPITDSYSDHVFFFRVGNSLQNTDGPCVAFLDPETSVHVGVPTQTPMKLALLGNYPNPFKHSTTIRYTLPADARVQLEVYDLQGRLVNTRDLGVQLAGPREAVANFNANAGVYLYRIRLVNRATGASMGTLAGKMMVLR